MGRRLTVVLLALAGLLLLAGPAHAQQDVATQESLNTTFFLLCMSLVFLMHAGFSMLETGLTGARNAGNIMMKNMMVISVGFLTYYAIGWGLHYGTSVLGLFGSSGFFLVPGTYAADLAADPFLSSGFMFDAVFAATAATIVSGAVAGRTNLWGFMTLAGLLTAFLYPVVGHWGWADGWAANAGFYDFAGSTVVHLTGGISALVAAAIVGPRLGKFGPDGKPRFMPGHSAPLAILGVFLLWFGWFGFNGGSVLNAEVAVGPVLVTTALAASAGALTAAIISAMRSGGKTDVSMVGNGILAGLVGVTAGADVLMPWAAILVGIVAGIVVSVAVPLVERAKIDDAVGAFSVHGACGVLGTVWVGLLSFSEEAGLGLLYGGDPGFLLIQVVTPLAVIVFVGGATAIVCLILKGLGMLRLPDDTLELGVDIHEHGVPGYPEGTLVGASSTAGQSGPPQ